MVGKLIYLSYIRPDICYAVGFVSQFMHDPTNENLQAALRIVRYLRSASGQGLYFKKNR